MNSREFKCCTIFTILKKNTVSTESKKQYYVELIKCLQKGRKMRLWLKHIGNNRTEAK